MAFERLFLVRLGYIGDCPAGLELPAVARNRRKSTVKNTKNRSLRCVATKGTIPDKLIYIHPNNDKQNYPFGRLKVVSEIQ